MTATYSPDPLYGRIWRDDQDTVTVDGREDPSERAGREPAEDYSLPDCQRNQPWLGCQATASPSSSSCPTSIWVLVRARSRDTVNASVMTTVPAPTSHARW